MFLLHKLSMIAFNIWMQPVSIKYICLLTGDAYGVKTNIRGKVCEDFKVNVFFTVQTTFTFNYYIAIDDENNDDIHMYK